MENEGYWKDFIHGKGVEAIDSDSPRKRGGMRWKWRATVTHRRSVLQSHMRKQGRNEWREPAMYHKSVLKSLPLSGKLEKNVGVRVEKQVGVRDVT